MAESSTMQQQSAPKNTSGKSVWIEQPVPHQMSRTYFYQDGTTVTKKNGTVSWRNNNEGNLRPGSLSSTRIGVDQRNFAVFATPEDGRAAKKYLLFSSSSYKDLTLKKAIARYAPESDNNNPTSYANFVMKNGNVADKVMSTYTADEQERILQAMKRQEGYKEGETIKGTVNNAALQNVTAQSASDNSGAAAPTTTGSEQIYVVKSGDTLSKIATQFNVTGGYMAIASLNNISDPSRISVGQKLRIPGTTATTATASSDGAASGTTAENSGGGAAQQNVTQGSGWAAAIKHLDGGKGTFTTRDGKETHSYGVDTWKKWCALGAKTLMEKAGYTYVPGNADQMGDRMDQYGYSQIAHVHKSSWDGFKDVKEGDVALHLPKDGNAGKMHMTLYLGGQWVSDTIQSKGVWVYGLKDENVRIYRKGGGKLADEAATKTENTGENASAGTTAENSGGGATGGLQMNAEGHPIYYPKGAQDTQDIIKWNKDCNYTDAYIKSFQKLIGTEADGIIGTDTVNAIRHYQEKNGLGQDGKWGKECADKSGLERKYNQTSSQAGSNANAGGAGNVVSENEKSATGQKVVDYAAQFIGHTYVWGGKGQVISKDSLAWLRKEYGSKSTSFKGMTTWAERYDWIVANRAGERAFDCSGLCVYSYRNAAKDVGQYRPEENEAVKVFRSKPALSEMKVGDVIVSDGHYQMYYGNGKAIESCGSKGVTNTLAWDYNGVKAVYRYFDD